MTKRELMNVLQEEQDQRQALERLTDLLCGDSMSRPVLGQKLLQQTRLFGVGDSQSCNRFGCVLPAVVGTRIGGAGSRRVLCREHVTELMLDLTRVEERHHVDGLPEFLALLVDHLR